MYSVLTRWQDSAQTARTTNSKWTMRLWLMLSMLMVMPLAIQNSYALPAGDVSYIDDWNYYYTGGTVRKAPSPEFACQSYAVWMNAVELPNRELAYTGVRLGSQTGFLVYGWCQMNERYPGLVGWTPWRPFNDYLAAWNSLTCPANSSSLTMSGYPNKGCTCKAGYIPNQGGTACVLPTVCQTGQVAHPDGGCMLDCSGQPGTHPNMKGTACIPNSSCPIPTVKPVTPLPTEATDPCSAALESQSSARIKASCPPLTPAMQNELDCLGEKLRLKGIAMNVTATVRTLAYQRHFREVWESMEKLIEKTIDDAALKAACAATRAELAAEKGCDNAGACTSCTGSPAHCLKARPAKPEPTANHPKGKAVDLKAANIKALLTVLKGPPPQTMQQFLAEPVTPPPPALACTAPKLEWGGLWPSNPDKVHFSLP